MVPNIAIAISAGNMLKTFSVNSRHGLIRNPGNSARNSVLHR
jgi:hypothetical protein